MRKLVPGKMGSARQKQVQALCQFLIDRIVAELGDLDAIRAADADEIAAAENVSPLWARHIVEGLRRFT